MTAEPKQPRRGLGCLIATVALLLIPVIVVVVFAGSLQRQIAESVIASTLSADAHVDSATLIGAIALSGMEISQPGAGDSTRPAITAATVDIAYSLLPGDGRYADTFHASDFHVTLQRDAAGNSNFQYLIDYLNAPPSDDDPMTLVPKQIRISPLEIEAATPDLGLQLQGLAVEGTLESETKSALRIQAPEVTGQWRLADVVEEARPLAGAVDIAVDRDGGDVTLSGTIDLDELASVDASANIQLTDSSTQFDVDIQEASFRQVLWGRLLRDLGGVPIGFESLEVSGAAFEGALVAGVLHLDNASLRGDARGVVLGDDSRTFYQGDMTLDLSGALGGAEDTFTAELQLSPGGALKVETKGPVDALQASIETGTWEIEAMRAALPEAYRSSLDFWPALSAMQLSGEVSRDGQTVNGSLALSPQVSTAAGNAPSIATEWQIELNEEDPTQSAYTFMALAKGDGSARIEAGGTGSTLSKANIHLEQTPLGKWYRVWQGTSFGDIDATLTGDIAAGPLDTARLPIDLNLNGSLRGVGEKPLAIAASGKGSYNPETRAASGVNGKLDLGALGHVTLKGAAFQSEPAKAAGTFASELDLDATGAAFGMPDLHGTATFTGTLGWDGTRMRLNDLKGIGDTLGYGDLFLPYGTETVLDTSLAFDPDTGRASLSPFNVALMDGTSIEASGLTLTTGDQSEVAAESMKVSSDLALLVSREYLAGADGEFNLTLADVRATGSYLHAGVDATLTAQSLILPNTLSVLRGVDAKLEFTYDNGMDGGGTVSVDEVEVAGTMLRALSSPVVCKGETITLKGLRTTLFGGQVTATIAANLGSESLQADVEATGEQIDLKVFTEEFEPPQVELTGKVHGTVTASLTPAGITAMDVDLESTEGFSVNREVVEDLLKSQDGGAMSDRVMNKVMKKMLGDEPQRPFDRAALTLTLQDDGRVGGEATLESSDLNLTVAIGADPEAILAALRSRQE